jgi:predicted metal-dependent hydrolase
MKRELARLLNWIAPGALKATAASGNTTRRIEVNGFTVDVTFKRIKNIYLRVVAPDGTVKVSAPKRISLKAVKEFVAARTDWIRHHQVKIAACTHQPLPRHEDAEIHQVWGEPCRLCIVEKDHAPFVELDQSRMILHVRPGADRNKRREIVETWRRNQVKKAAEPLIAKWESIMGVTVARLSVRRMKTRWGSCSSIKRSIRLNTNLSSKPPELLEYVVVHELVHLLEPSHNGRFRALMDRFLPDWRDLRNNLNQRENIQLNSQQG